MQNKLLYWFLFIIGLLAFSAFLDFKFLNWNRQFQVSFLNIGQGDATLIQTPNNCRILVDGGPKTELSQRIGRTLPILEKNLDLVVITHPHADHYAGIAELQNRYKYKNIWITGVDYESAEYRILLDNLSKSEQTTFITKPAEYFLCGVKIMILQPLESLIGKTIQNANNSSIVLLIEMNNQWLLLTGDAEEEQESELIENYSQLLQSLDIKVFKAGHHGSRTSNSEELLKLIQPEIMVISAGKNNSYKHPHFETLEKANNLGIKLYRTDLLEKNQDINLFF